MLTPGTISVTARSSLRRTRIRFPDDALSRPVGYRRRVPPIPSLTRSTAMDAVLAGILAVVAEAEILAGQVAGPRAAAIPLALLLTLPLAVRRAYPLPVAVAVSASFVLNWAVGVDMYSYWASVIAALVVAYTVAAHLQPRLAVLALACLYAAVVVSALGTSGLLWGGILIGGAALACLACATGGGTSASSPNWLTSWSWLGTRTPAPRWPGSGSASCASCTMSWPIRSA